jgi:ribosome maturation factor RimP
MTSQAEMALVLPEEIRTILTDICSAEGAHLLEIVLRGTRERMMLEVYIDTAQGVTLDLCERINRRINEEAEKQPFLNSIRSVEVSSPGATRPLQFWWQYPRHAGRTLEIRLKTEDPTAGAHKFQLLAADEHALTVLPVAKGRTGRKKAEEHEIIIPHSNIEQALVVIEI